MSRKRTFALIAALAALTALLSACGGGGGGSSEDPQKVIEQATFEGVESGTVDLTMNIKAEGENSGNMKIDLSGPFQSTGKESLPELAMQVKADGEADGENVNFEGGLTVLGDRAYVGFEGKNYEVDPTTFGFVKSSIEKGEQEGEKESAGAERTACQKAATSMNLEEFVDNLENEGSEDIDGTGTTKLSGDLNPQKAVDAAIKLAETPACANQAFALGPNILGLQFHPEADAKRIERWLIGHACELATAGVEPGVLRTDAARYGAPLRDAGRLMFSQWLKELRP